MEPTKRDRWHDDDTVRRLRDENRRLRETLVGFCENYDHEKRDHEHVARCCRKCIATAALADDGAYVAMRKENDNG